MALVFMANILLVYPNPTFFQPREASEPYSRGQWDNALKATPHSPEVMFHASGH
jgi:hypothetical protein